MKQTATACCGILLTSRKNPAVGARLVSSCVGIRCRIPGVRLRQTVREAIADARQRGIAVILVTGRQVSDLRRLAGDLTCFDVVVAEDGAVLEFPASGPHVSLSHPPNPAFLLELKQQGVPFAMEHRMEVFFFCAPTLEEPVCAVEKREQCGECNE